LQTIKKKGKTALSQRWKKKREKESRIISNQKTDFKKMNRIIQTKLSFLCDRAVRE
jgi:hypothetical protein